MLPPFSVLTRPERLTFSKVSVQACQPGGDAPHWGFLSAARKEPKTTKGGAFPRLVESTPPVLGGACVLLCSALDWFMSHRWLSVLWFPPTPLLVLPSTARALSWCAAVPSGRWPGSRRRERLFSRVGPDMETTWL